MREVMKWEHCILQRGSDVSDFMSDVFGEAQRSILLIAGAGFDPRTRQCTELLAVTAGSRVTGFFMQEERPNPNPELLRRSVNNTAALQALVPDSVVVVINIFTTDNAVVAGRNAINALATKDLSVYTDVCIDCSALSRGVIFPVVKYVLDKTSAKNTNVHVLVADEPGTDAGIISRPWERADYMHGFRGSSRGDKDPGPARLWLPQLVPGQKTAFDLIHALVDPNDTCPILPFPGKDLRAPDLLIQEYANQLQNIWRVDPRNLVYADEGNPLDVYRSILLLDSARARVFQKNRQSQLILSPLGSKLLSIGALMAAIDRGFPVVYVEALEYSVDFEQLDVTRNAPGPLVHLWLQGEAYA